MTFGGRIISIFVSAAGVSTLVLAWLLIYQTVSRLPETQELKHLKIAMDQVDHVVLGRAELAQPVRGPTDEKHIAFARGDADGIMAFDVSADRRVGYKPKDGQYSDSSWIEIPEGRSVIEIGGSTWLVERVGVRLVLCLRKPGNRACSQVPMAEEFVLTPAGIIYAPLDGEEQIAAFVPFMTRQRGRFLGDMNLSYHVGGAFVGTTLSSLLETRRLPAAELPLEAAQISYRSRDFSLREFFSGHNGRWTISPGRSLVQLSALEDDFVLVPEAQPIPITTPAGEVAVDYLVIGRTYYRVSYAPDVEELTLEPFLRRARLAAEEVVDSKTEGVESVLTPLSTPVTEAGLLASAGLTFCLAVLCFIYFALPGSRRLRGLMFAAVGLVLTVSTEGNLFSVAALALFVAAGLAVFPTIWRAFWAFYLVVRWRQFVWAREDSRRLRNAISVLISASALSLTGVAAWFIGALAEEVSSTRLELAVCGAWLALAAPFLAAALAPRVALLWSLTVGIAAFGAAAGLQLALLESTNAYGALFERHLQALGLLGLVATSVVSSFASGGAALLKRLSLPRRRPLWLYGLFAFFSLAFLGLTLFGDETGFFGIFQPSEIAKSLLVFLVAVTLSQDLARRTMTGASEGALRFTAPVLALLFAIAVLATSAANYDMSPILVCIIAMFFTLLAGAAIHYNELHRQRSERRRQGLPIAATATPLWQVDADVIGPILRRRRQAVLGLWPIVLTLTTTLLLIFATFWMFNSPSLREGAPFGLFDSLLTPWIRVQSWYDLAFSNAQSLIQFPQTGIQLRNAREALIAAECRWVTSLCPEALIPVSIEEGRRLLLRVPAIQDDFAAVSLVHFLGVDGAIFYASAQFALVGAALSVGISTLLLRGDQRIIGWVLGCSVLGLTALYFAQIGLAWANVLGLFPIMGQPMTFVSFGGSHHLGVALPFVATTLAASALTGQPAVGLRPVSYELFRQKLLD